MTEGHTHRIVTVKRGGHLHRFLTKPRWHTVNLMRVDASPYPYGLCAIHVPLTASQPCYHLSILSVLHRWTGLTLKTRD